MQLVNESDPILRSPCKLVEIGEDLSEFITGMRDILDESGGVGLAANQVGYNKRVIVVRDGNFYKAYINPVISKRYGGRQEGIEGCLSYPKKFIKKKRYRKIILEAYTKDWRKVRIRMEGSLARCVQHEVDHLNGITIFK